MTTTQLSSGSVCGYNQLCSKEDIRPPQTLSRSPALEIPAGGEHTFASKSYAPRASGCGQVKPEVKGRDGNGRWTLDKITWEMRPGSWIWMSEWRQPKGQSSGRYAEWDLSSHAKGAIEWAGGMSWSNQKGTGLEYMPWGCMATSCAANNQFRTPVTPSCEL